MLSDPGNTRKVKNLPLPPQRPMESSLLFQNGAIRLNSLK